jgi:hypothetical protein
MKLQEIKEIANDTGVHAERGYHLKNFANRIVELDRQQRTWVGLTDEEYDEIWRMDLNNKDIMDKTIAKLKEKNT